MRVTLFTRCLPSIQTIEQAAVDEWCLGKERQQFIGVVHLFFVSVTRKIAIGIIGFFAKRPFVYLCVQSGEKEFCSTAR